MQINNTINKNRINETTCLLIAGDFNKDMRTFLKKLPEDEKQKLNSHLQKMIEEYQVKDINLFSTYKKRSIFQAQIFKEGTFVKEMKDFIFEMNILKQPTIFKGYITGTAKLLPNDDNLSDHTFVSKEVTVSIQTDESKKLPTTTPTTTPTLTTKPTPTPTLSTDMYTSLNSAIRTTKKIDANNLLTNEDWKKQVREEYPINNHELNIADEVRKRLSNKYLKYKNKYINLHSNLKKK